MSTTSATPVAASRRNIVSRLWNDKESRSIIIQIFAFILILSGFFYLGNNAAQNLETLGKDISFDFLFQPSSYDINQHLISYDSRSPHIRAMYVGIINTLLVAVAGIFLATIVGFLLGVLRLSKNWITNRLAYVYIDYVRNVPVLIHILIIHGIIVQSLPSPRKALNLADTAFLSNRGLSMPRPLFEPLFWIVFGLFLAGIVFTIWFRRYAKKVQDQTGKHYPVFWICSGAMIGIPLVFYFLLGSPIEWQIPYLDGFNFSNGMVIAPEFIALWLALSLYTAAFIAEIVRAGILAVSYGQTEAAFALGLKRSKVLNLVVIPQALRVIIPPLTSQYLNLTKNSSLAIAIGYMDIVATIGGITLNQTGRAMECMTIVLGLYLIISLVISGFMNWYNKRIKLVER